MSQWAQGETRDLRLAIWLVSAVYLATAAFATWLAVREGLAGRPFGWDLGLQPLPSFVFGLGTALSAPLVLLLALIVITFFVGRADRSGRRAAGLLVILGIGFLVGMLAEPITWQLLNSGSSDRIQAAVVIANLALPVVMVLLAVRIRVRGHFRTSAVPK